MTVTYDRNRTTFTREGSFRVLTLTEQKEKANEAKESGKEFENLFTLLFKIRYRRLDEILTNDINE